MEVNLMHEQAQELLSRKFIHGTSVTNCVKHSDRDLDHRPIECALCRTDIQNHSAKAIRINDWLNVWKEDAEKVLLRVVFGVARPSAL